jgi:4-carboxymuconolactone decarboxylase
MTDHAERDGRGARTRRRVLGDAHVDRAEAAATEFDAPFQALITAAAWDRVWSRPDITPRERSMLTIALLAALGHEDELAMHVRATARTGATAADIREALLHVAIYAGVPAANRAFRVAKRTLAEMATGREEQENGG